VGVGKRTRRQSYQHQDRRPASLAEAGQRLEVVGACVLQVAAVGVDPRGNRRAVCDRSYHARPRGSGDRGVRTAGRTPLGSIRAGVAGDAGRAEHQRKTALPIAHRLRIAPAPWTSSSAVRVGEDGQVSESDRGFNRPYEILCRGVELPRVSTAFGALALCFRPIYRRSAFDSRSRRCAAPSIAAATASGGRAKKKGSGKPGPSSSPVKSCAEVGAQFGGYCFGRNEPRFPGNFARAESGCPIDRGPADRSSPARRVFTRGQPSRAVIRYGDGH
jgi:hypothetical protein